MMPPVLHKNTITSLFSRLQHVTLIFTNLACKIHVEHFFHISSTFQTAIRLATYVVTIKFSINIFYYIHTRKILEIPFVSEIFTNTFVILYCIKRVALLKISCPILRGLHFCIQDVLLDFFSWSMTEHLLVFLHVSLNISKVPKNFFTFL